MSEPCPVCKSELKDNHGQYHPIIGPLESYFACPRCGSYRLSRSTVDDLASILKEDSKKITVLSHAIRKMQKNTEIPFLDQRTVALILQNPLPKPSEQMNNFVIWLGDYLPSLGKDVYLDMLYIQSEIGAITHEGVNSVIKHLIEKKIVSGEKFFGLGQTWQLTLTIDGWEYYENLKRGGISSRKAFMAMQYGDKDLDELVTSCFRPAIKDAGFDLYRLDDVPKAGLIDDRLRIEIRTSRFLIADLTHQNAGAYWEAGYAEGLGKPVIYTCEKKKFKEQKTHFDTNHHTTVLWDKDDLEKTARDLKNTIRATLPEGAKLTDDE